MQTTHQALAQQLDDLIQMTEEAYRKSGFLVEGDVDVSGSTRLAWRRVEGIWRLLVIRDHGVSPRGHRQALSGSHISMKLSCAKVIPNLTRALQSLAKVQQGRLEAELPKLRQHVEGL